MTITSDIPISMEYYTELYSSSGIAVGTTVDIVRISAENVGGRRDSVVASQEDVRGVAPNTYYYKFANIGAGTINCTFHGWWEQR